MMTGLYPAGHGVHENARYVVRSDAPARRAACTTPAIARRRSSRLLRWRGGSGWRAGSSVTTTTSDRDAPSARRKRRPTRAGVLEQPRKRRGSSGSTTTIRTIRTRRRSRFAARYANAAVSRRSRVDGRAAGRLVAAFEQNVDRAAIVVAGDHGEGLGDHGEAAAWQPALPVDDARAAAVIAGPGVHARRQRHAGQHAHDLPHDPGLGGRSTRRTACASRIAEDVIVGEAMKPFLDYGWQPQVMAVEGRLKTILAGKGWRSTTSSPIRARRTIWRRRPTLSRAGARGACATIRSRPPTAAEPPTNLERGGAPQAGQPRIRGADGEPVVRKDAPRPADMALALPIARRASALFVRERYAASDSAARADPRAGSAQSRRRAAAGDVAFVARARPQAARSGVQESGGDRARSPDVRTYLALHYARGKEWQRAVPLLERIVAEDPDRLPALEALAVIRERQGRLEEAVDLRQKVYAMRSADGRRAGRGSARWRCSSGPDAGRDRGASKRRARLDGGAFRHDLELGVLYLASRPFRGRARRARPRPVHRSATIRWRSSSARR